MARQWDGSEYVTVRSICSLCGHRHSDGPCDFQREGCPCTEVAGLGYEDDRP